jgi:excisionase family DNA binding protein
LRPLAQSPLRQRKHARDPGNCQVNRAQGRDYHPLFDVSVGDFETPRPTVSDCSNDLFPDCIRRAFTLRLFAVRQDALAISLTLQHSYVAMVTKGKGHRSTMVAVSTVMTSVEISDYLQIDRGTLYRLIKKGGIPYFRLGKDYRFNSEAIDQWRELLEKSGTQPKMKRRR